MKSDFSEGKKEERQHEQNEKRRGFPSVISQAVHYWLRKPQSKGAYENSRVEIDRNIFDILTLLSCEWGNQSLVWFFPL